MSAGPGRAPADDSPRSTPWWEAAPLELTPAQARRAAMGLIGRGAHFNACQLDFLWSMALRRRRLTDRDQQVMGALTALADQGGRGWLDAT